MEATLNYHLCPRCLRATPAAARERFCPNDGAELLTACPTCAGPIASPYSRFCPRCGQGFAQLTQALGES